MTTSEHPPFDGNPDPSYSADRLTELRRRLVQAAARENLLDVAYRRLDTAVGPLLLAATELGLVRVAFAREGHDAVLQDLADQISPRVMHAPGTLDTVVGQLDEYFAGRRRRFTLALDRCLSRGFSGTVHERLGDIGYGETISYQEMARRAGRPDSGRAVGAACGENPLPVVVPCHRVIRANGQPGGYRGGDEAKRYLLTLESAERTP
jgi:methylated-DNA-[protein]-cysteine S-methyltransferase